MGLFSCTIQAESDADKPAPVFEEQRIYSGETRSIADKAERITGVCYTLDDFSKSAMYRRLAASEAYLLNATAFTFAQHLFQDRQRKIASRGMSLVKAVAAAQVTAIGQLNDDTRQFVAPRASRRRSINFSGW